MTYAPTRKVQRTIASTATTNRAQHTGSLFQIGPHVDHGFETYILSAIFSYIPHTACLLIFGFFSGILLF